MRHLFHIVFCSLLIASTAYWLCGVLCATGLFNIVMYLVGCYCSADELHRSLK